MSLPTPHSDVVYEHVDGHAVLVNLRTNRIYSLNETGARLWALLVEGRDRASAESILAAEFDVPTSTLSREIDDLLESFRAAGLTAS